MSSYSGYVGRNVYREEFYYPSLRVAQKVLLGNFQAAFLSAQNWQFAVIVDPVFVAAGWEEGTPIGDHWWRWFGFYRGVVTIGEETVDVVFFDAIRWLDIARYFADGKANRTYNVLRDYPDAPIPFRWRTNVWIPPLF